MLSFTVLAPFGLRDDVFSLILSLPVICYSSWIFLRTHRQHHMGALRGQPAGGLQTDAAAGASQHRWRQSAPLMPITSGMAASDHTAVIAIPIAVRPVSRRRRARAAAGVLPPLTCCWCFPGGQVGQRKQQAGRGDAGRSDQGDVRSVVKAARAESSRTADPADDLHPANTLPLTVPATEPGSAARFSPDW